MFRFKDTPPGVALARLKSLSNEAGSNHYERIGLVDRLLNDEQWLKSNWNGDDYKAAEALEENYFQDLSGSMTIFQLLQIFRRFPNLKDWVDRKYNLRSLLEACVANKPGKRAGRLRSAHHSGGLQTSLKEERDATTSSATSSPRLE